MHCSISKLADLSGFSRETVATRLRDGGMEPTEGSTATNKQFRSELALPILYGTAGGSDSAELAKARTRLTDVQTELQRLELDKRKRVLLEAAEVEQVVAHIFRLFGEGFEAALTMSEHEYVLPTDLLDRLQKHFDGVRTAVCQRVTELFQDKPATPADD
ncbi:MAG: DUF1441 family protein [Candidatus Competibacteraceae bacterium]|nr:DUF1441 family protein [Candidatus Competibacteraceae bacterium]